VEIRPDFKEVESLLQRLVQFGNVFYVNNHEKWSHLKHKEDFNRVYSLPRETRIPLEEIYSVGRDIAVFMGSRLDAFNDPESFPTLKKYVDSFDGTWVDQVDHLTSLSKAASDTHSKLGEPFWSVDQMIQLFDTQLSLLKDVRRTLDGLRTSSSYAFDASESVPSSQQTQPAYASPVSQFFEIIYRIAVLWVGDPKSRYPTLLALAGIALIAAPWWQQVFQQAAVKYFQLPGDFLAKSESSLFWSGWVFVGISVVLYVWLKSREGSQG